VRDEDLTADIDARRFKKPSVNILPKCCVLCGQECSKWFLLSIRTFFGSNWLHRADRRQLRFKGASKNYDTGPSSRHAKILTAGSLVVFRGLQFEHKAEIELIDNF
jgi:hypothetical protein